jgi:hypothetical protein
MFRVRVGLKEVVMYNQPTSYEDALASARTIRTLIIKAAKERLNATLRAHHESDVREEAWRIYDVAIKAAWDAHDAMVRRVENTYRKTTLAEAKQPSCCVIERGDAKIVRTPATARVA